MLFANADGGALFLLCLVCGVIGIGYAYYCHYMATNHPQLWSEMCQRAHERRMHAARLRAERERQRLEHERMQKEAARRSRNSMMLGIGGVLLRAFLGHHHRH